MSEPDDHVQDEPLIRVFKIVRTVAAWAALIAAISFAITVIFFSFPHPSRGPNVPAAPLGLLRWRNWSLLAAFVFGLISVPKWQSLTALIGSILLLVYAVMTYD